MTWEITYRVQLKKARGVDLNVKSDKIKEVLETKLVPKILDLVEAGFKKNNLKTDIITEINWVIEEDEEIQ